ncbi:MAG: 16S rRNA (guanine(527)-N(7))-methyltransferase RsmG [candidate division Zixibacteria bacterium RBG_16_48_11]|nr:MAG: 16S rRNA (guanine(527)-N(7))-methyltransferase RsmG [candidate division Zixibacteria bacterium RBG_16_48_11]
MTDSEFFGLLRFQASQLNLKLDEIGLNKLYGFAQILLEWNQRIHLVSKKDSDSVRLARQIIDSLLLLVYFEIPSANRVLDLGSGAGFPAVPLKIVRPDLEIVLTESKQKKSAYLQDVIEQLQLTKVFLWGDRAQKLPVRYTNYFDLALAKASGDLANSWAEVYQFLKSGANFLAYKGKKIEKEQEGLVRLFKKLPGRIDRIVKIDIQELDLGGCIVAVKKL